MGADASDKGSPEPDPRVTQWVRPEIRALSAYAVQDAGDLIKLDAMENPYPWPASPLVDEWLVRLRDPELNRYPDSAARTLKARLREWLGLAPRFGLVLGNGSDELIQMIDLAVAAPDRVVLAPEPTFVMYRMIAAFAGMRYVGVPLRGDFGLDRPAMLEALARHAPAVVYLAYPNNPTGNCFDDADVRAVIEAAPGLVVVDEAYAPFTDHSFIAALGEHDHLLVLRTLSKMGLAGLRLGMLAGSAAWLTEVEKVRLPYNVNTLTQLSADFALEHRAVLAGQAAEIRAERARLAEALAALPGLTVYPSEANFLLVRVRGGRASALFEGLKSRGVLVKNLDPAGGALRDCLRVTVGRREENDAFLAALQGLLF